MIWPAEPPFENSEMRFRFKDMMLSPFQEHDSPKKTMRGNVSKQISNISTNTDNVGDFEFQYFQEHVITKTPDAQDF